MHLSKDDGNSALNGALCSSWLDRAALIFLRKCFSNSWSTFLPSRTSRSSQKSSPAPRTVCTYRAQVSCNITQNVKRLTVHIDKDVIDVALVGKIPTPPSVTTDGTIGASWWTQNTSGLFRHACDSSGSYSYTPLYTLKTIRKKGILRRESPTPSPVNDEL
jgi:hypothetical protein